MRHIDIRIGAVRQFQLVKREDEMSRACSTNGGEEECIWDIGGGARRKQTTRKMKT
jgi:hypothetical protein